MMYFDQTGKYVKLGDMHNNKLDVMDDHLSNNSNGACHGICLQYTAQKPVGGGRYSSGQKRCQMCEIWMTVQGTKDEKGLYCKCCHYRVRGKPRNLKYKEILRNNEKNKPEIDVTNDIEVSNYAKEHRFSSNIESDTPEQDNDDVNESWIDVNEDYRNMDEELSEKKSAPVDKEFDESVKTFYEFKEFLDTINLQANYQLVMLKELIEYGENHKGEIAESLAYFNNKDTTNLNAVKYYFDVPVYNVLLNHGFVITKGYAHNRFPIYKLNVQLNEPQKIGILEIVENKLNEYNKSHEIPENEFPNSDNRGSIVWNSTDTLEKFKQIDPELSSTIWREQQEKIVKDTSEGILGKIYQNLTKKRHDTPLTNEQSSYISESIPTFAKTCPKCNVTQVTASLRQEFEEKIEESFGYRHPDPDKMDKKIPQSWCRPCRNLNAASNVEPEIIEPEIIEPEIIEPEIIEPEIPSSDIVDTKIFNFDNGELNIQNCKILSTDTITKDQILTNDEIISTFKVGNMGGIRYTKYNNVIVLFSTHSDDYDDSMDLNSGFIIYTGEGKGDQQIKNGNEKILNSQNTPMVYFKEVYQEPGSRPRGALDNKYKFIGVVRFHKYNWATEKGRKVIKFILEILS